MSFGLKVFNSSGNQRFSSEDSIIKSVQQGTISLQKNQWSTIPLVYPYPLSNVLLLFTASTDFYVSLELDKTNKILRIYSDKTITTGYEVYNG